MKFKIIEKKENKFLERTEVTAELDHDKEATPSAAALQKVASKELKSKVDRTEVVSIRSKHGMSKSVAKIYVWKKKEVPNMEKEVEKKKAEAEEGETKPEKKKEEGQKEEKPPEEKPVKAAKEEKPEDKQEKTKEEPKEEEKKPGEKEEIKAPEEEKGERKEGEK